MARRPQDPQIRVNEILDAAEHLFAGVGYRKTTIGDIAKKLGVAQGMLYYYFKSKEEILEEIIKRQVYEAICKSKDLSFTEGVVPSSKMNLLLSSLLDGAGYKDGLLLDSLNDERNLYVKDRLARQIKLLITPILLRIIEEGVEKQYFRVVHRETAKDYILNILDLLIDGFYEKMPADQFSLRLRTGEILIEKVLEAEAGSIRIMPGAKTEGQAVMEG